jgi:aryl-alcohol dehydrogenase-like predicted oxidoreductase
MTIISKCCHHYIDEAGRHHPDKQRVKPEFITQDLLESLDRMQVDYFDIYLLHRDDLNVPVGELMDTLQNHKDAGLIKAYGVSNWSIARIEAASEYCAQKGYAGLAVNSPSLSLAKANEPRWPGCVYPDREYIKWHKRTQLPMLSWAAQASGFFSGRYAPGKDVNPDITRVYYNEGNWERLRRAARLASEKGRRYTANHIALAYVINQPYPTCAVIGSQRVDELLNSFVALDLHLSEAELIWLDLVTMQGTSVCHQ